jgi:hypothetical protein
MIFVFAFSVSGYSGNGQMNFPPTADAGPDQLVECTSPSGTDVTLDGSGSSDPDGDALTFDWTWTSSSATGENPTINLPLGTTTVTLEVSDGVFSDQDTSDNTVEDTLPPVSTCPPGTITAECDDPEPPFNYSFNDQCDPDLFIDAISAITLGNCEGEAFISRSVSATDASGYISSCSQSVEILDTTPPSLSCPADISVQTTSSGGTVVNYLVPSSSDNCDPSVTTAICTPPPGLFPVGTTTVECSASDDCGNTSICDLEIEVILACVDPNPRTQGYWHRQCLGVPASEGGLDPGRNGRGPSKVMEPDFVDVLMPAADAVLEEKLSISNSCSEGMDADPPSSKCERAIKQYTALVFNQLSDRVRNSCEVDLSPWGCVSTNVGDLIDELAALINSGDPHSCKLAAECAALVNEGEGLEIPGIELNEIRIDQPSTDIDEYFELIGPAGMTLNGLTYLVIGDGTGGSGVIEAVIELTGNGMPSSGFFVAAENTFTLGSADLTASLIFENSDNVTHMIVSDFIGSRGDDLDTDDDGILDVTPWSEIVDCVSLIETVGSGDMVYCSETVGPDGSFVPAHVYHCPSGWVIGPFNPVGGDDTPGAANICI